MKQVLAFIFLLSVNACTVTMERDQKQALEFAKQQEEKRLAIVAKLEAKRADVHARVLMKIDQKRADFKAQAELEESEK